MTTISMPLSPALVPSLETAWQDVNSSFERFCLTAGIGAIEQMLCEDAQFSREWPQQVVRVGLVAEPPSVVVWGKN